MLLLSMLMSQGAQPAPTLEQYLAAHPVANSLVVSSEKTKANGPGVNLAQFNRRTFKLGDVTAIVPLEMVQFNDEFGEPNLYDGLPREAKVLYLLSTLNAQQTRTANSSGIGLADLNTEQRPVFLSIVPKGLKWEKFRVDDEGRAAKKLGEGVLDAKEAQGLKIKIDRRMGFMVGLGGGSRGYYPTNADSQAGRPGEEAFRWNKSAEDDPQDLFGVPLRTVVPNSLKKGNLNTSRLNVRVSIPAKSTIGEALTAIGSATGLELIADLRAAKRSLAFNGGVARAGDLLDAIALAQCAVYRKVGSAYLLTADIVGSGTRRLKQGLWRADIQATIEDRKRQWRKSIADSGLAKNLTFDPNDPLKPSSIQEPMVNKSPFDTHGNIEHLPVNLFTPEQSAFINRSITSRQGEGRLDLVSINSEIRYRFVLPNGSPLQLENGLGESWEFVPMAPRPSSPDPVAPRGENLKKFSRPLVVRANSSEEAGTAAQVAKEYGFSELWIETERSDVLSAAMASGLPSRLYVRPWVIPSSVAGAARADSDKTILGETGRQTAERLAASASWAKEDWLIRYQGWPRIKPIVVDEDLYSPFDDRIHARISTIASLAKTPGLTGVVVDEAMPHGYEAQDEGVGIGGYTRELDELWALGYDEKARLAFLRQYGIDPIDITSPNLWESVDVFSPFFSPFAPDPIGQLHNGADGVWRQFRVKAHQNALNELRSALPSIPIWIDVRRTIPQQPPLNEARFVPWNAGEPFPSYKGQYVESRTGVSMICAPPLRMKDAQDEFRNGIRVKGPSVGEPFALDLTRLAPGTWRDYLAGCLIPRSGTH